MRISSKSRDIVRLENAQASNELAKAFGHDIESIRVTMPRGGATESAVDNRLVQYVRESLGALTESYIHAVKREGVDLTLTDNEETSDEMSRSVRALLEGRLQIDPRSVGIGFRDRLDQVVLEQRHALVLAMKRMELNRTLPRRMPVESRNIYNVSGSN